MNISISYCRHLILAAGRWWISLEAHSEVADSTKTSTKTSTHLNLIQIPNQIPNLIPKSNPNPNSKPKPKPNPNPKPNLNPNLNPNFKPDQSPITAQIPGNGLGFHNSRPCSVRSAILAVTSTVAYLSGDKHCRHVQQ